jgi:hypothetical protein
MHRVLDAAGGDRSVEGRDRSVEGRDFVESASTRVSRRYQEGVEYGQRQVFVSDLRHFLDLPSDVPAPARRMAGHLTGIVRAATAGDGGVAWVSALTCSRRPGRRPCHGRLALFRTDVPPVIEWRCTSCGDEGVIRGWERSAFDLRSRSSDPRRTDTLHAVIPPEVTATLRTLMLLDTDAERLVFRARATEEGVVLVGDEDGFDELVDALAAEANHEEDRRRRTRLDHAFDVLSDAVRPAAAG